MVFNLTHSQIILRYKENGGRIEPYTIVIMRGGTNSTKSLIVLRNGPHDPSPDALYHELSSSNEQKRVDDTFQTCTV
jgi:hypothetical protein